MRMIDWAQANISGGQTVAYSTAYDIAQAADTHNHNYTYTIPAIDNHEHAHYTYGLSDNDTYRITTNDIDVSTISAEILSQGIWELCYKDEYKPHKKISLPSRDELMDFLTDK